jgi:exonuclease III
MGFERKAEALLSLEPNVAVVPECAETSVVGLHRQGYNALWFGSNTRKGLAVISRNWPIQTIAHPKQKWIVPITVGAPKPFTLIAVWACRVSLRKADNYIGQVYQALASNPDWFDANPVVVAGDFNSNAIWDAERLIGNHSAVVKFLGERGIVSAYHEHFKELQGQESRPTIHLYRHKNRPFHIDYVFIPREWAAGLESVVVGEFEEWSTLSDHLPVIIDLRKM